MENALLFALVGTSISVFGATRVIARPFLKYTITHHAIKCLQKPIDIIPSSYIYPGRIKRLVISDPAVYVGAKTHIGSKNDILYETTTLTNEDDKFKWLGLISEDVHGTTRRLPYMDCLDHLNKTYKINPCDIPKTESREVSLWESDWIDDAIIMKSNPKKKYDYLIGTKNEVAEQYAKDEVPFGLSIMHAGLAITCMGVVVAWSASL